MSLTDFQIEETGLAVALTDDLSLKKIYFSEDID